MKNKLYVLVLITVMDRAGAETIMMNYLRNINRDRIQMDFLINRAEKSDYEDEIESIGSRVYHMCGLMPGRFGRYKREFKQFLQEHPEYTIIHSHLEERSYFALSIAKKMGVPVRIVHAHSVPNHLDLKLPMRLYFRHKLKGTYTHRFACSEEPAKWLYGTSENVTYMKNAIDTAKFSYNQSVRAKVRQQLNISEETLVIGHIGRFIYEKNQSFIVDIFKKVDKIYRDCRLLLIGGGKPKAEIAYKTEIRKKVTKLGLDDKVDFLGIREDIPELMQAMDFLVMPSISEGFPVTLVEAQAAGLNCLVSDAVTYKCNVTGEMQFMSLEEETVEWANKILSWNSSDSCGKNERKHKAESMNRKVVEAGYDIRANADWLCTFYENLAKENGRDISY